MPFSFSSRVRSSLLSLTLLHASSLALSQAARAESKAENVEEEEQAEDEEDSEEEEEEDSTDGVFTSTQPDGTHVTTVRTNKGRTTRIKAVSPEGEVMISNSARSRKAEKHTPGVFTLEKAEWDSVNHTNENQTSKRQQRL